MNESILVSKNDENQTPIPEVWRNTFSQIVEAFKDGDFRLQRGIARVFFASADCAAGIEENIRSYGCQLTGLPEEAWKTSACQWMRGYWDVLIDLYTIQEGASDLVLAVRVYEDENETAFLFKIQSVYVP